MSDGKANPEDSQDLESRGPGLSASPSGARGSQVRCKRCGTDVPARDQCAICGAFLEKNEANLRHGLRRYQTKGTLPVDLKRQVEEFRDALIDDQGGPEDMTAVRAGLVGILVDLEVGRRLLMAEVVRRRIDSRPGRAAYDKLLSTIDRWHRIASTLGPPS